MEYSIFKGNIADGGFIDTDKGKLSVYMLEDCEYQFGFDPRDISVLLDFNYSDFMAKLSGSRYWWIREYLEEQNSKLYKDAAQIYILKDVTISENCKHPIPSGKIDIVPYESLHNILYGYARAYLSKSLKRASFNIAENALWLINIIFHGDTLRSLYEACGYTTGLDINFPINVEVPLFTIENRLLDEALEDRKPGTAEDIYDKNRCTIYKHAYKDILGVKAFEKLSQKRDMFIRLHNYITPKHRELVRLYITLFAATLKEWTRKDMFKPKPAPSHFSQVRAHVRNMIKDLK